MLIHFQRVGQYKSDNSCSLELFCPNPERGAGGGQSCSCGAQRRGPRPSSSLPPVLHQPLHAVLCLHIWLLSLLSPLIRDISKHLADASSSQCSRWLMEKRGAAGVSQHVSSLTSPTSPATPLSRQAERTESPAWQQQLHRQR